MPIDPTLFGEEDFLASRYRLGTENDTVTVMNHSAANLMNQDQATLSPDANNMPGICTQTRKTVKKTVRKLRRRRQTSSTRKDSPRISRNQKIALEFSSLDKEVLTSKKKNYIYSKSPTSSSSSIDDQHLENICDEDSNHDISPTNEQETCFICNEFGKNKVWYRHRGCGQWSHKDCSGADAPDKYL
ncbi:hypothetical protein ILUMI_19654 [Ignelater luminosus]|uniref:Uncharacterized protein n=1 Tax=Ignelater luminosus TaxID=2038154 RepID=A0A8K0CHS7_IGNLU|nr:hypothetical protein ILUMI_19654 [Ignelater luminosus]